MNTKKGWSRLRKTLLGIVLFIGLTTGCTELKTECEFQDTVQISAQNVPAGTYYADLLVQLPEKDKLRVPDTGVRLDGTDITENSEIFRYSEGNYVSASLHYGYAESISFPQNANTNLLCTYLNLHGNTKDGRFSKGKDFLRIPSFRIAYVSQDGKVLGVTGSAAANPIMSPLDVIVFEADGSSARYCYISGSKVNPAEILLFLELLLLVVLVLPLYAVVSRICKKREWNAVVKQIQQNAEQPESDEKGSQP